MNALAGKPQTVSEALAAGSRTCGAGGQGRRDAALLLQHVLRCNRAWLIAHPEHQLSSEDLQRFAELCERRASGSPAAYLLGSAGFYGREFVVNESVLVPRPETEHLVDEALAFLDKRIRRSGVATVLDVGVGSGAIACTIACALEAVFVEGTDCSAAAIEIATLNARRLGVSERCRFSCGNLIAPVKDRSFDVILANLPYVPSGELPRPPAAAAFEPREALDGGPDGLAAYRELMPQTGALLKAGGLLLLEAAPPIACALRSLAAEAFAGAPIVVGMDYAGLARYVRVVAPEVRQAPAAK
ncbi:MAG: peptide chain release factor N(5)-glutamine methyltransferase [Candidatus Eremiobacteraeota bacterium]|nr:peptide chain release factor N(5)-glutamine methyltransferase [Candidatus Eremiobacteraeota bacterium]